MSRRRTGWSPESWENEGPAEHVTRLGGFIEAEPVGRMRPILVHGQTMTDTRRESAKRASRRYRARAR